MNLLSEGLYLVENTQTKIFLYYACFKGGKQHMSALSPLCCIETYTDTGLYRLFFISNLAMWILLHW